MEALAAVIGVVGPVCQAASKIFQIVSAVRNSTDNLHRLRRRIELLHHALEGVQVSCSLRQGCRLLPPERFHYKSIAAILQGCQRSLFILERQLPSVPSDPSLASQIALAIEQKFSQDDVNQAVEDIKHYTTVLNLTLSSLSLVHSLETQSTQAQILQDVQRFARQLRNTVTFSMNVPYTTDQTFILVGGREVRDPTLALDVQQWSSTATRLAEGVLIEGDQNHNELHLGPVNDITGSAVSDASALRATGARFNQPLEMHKYGWNIKISKLLKEGELYYNASLYLQTAIEIRKSLVESGAAHLGNDNDEMMEELADLMDLPAACYHLEIALQTRLDENPRDTAKIIDTCRVLREARYEAGDHAEYHATRDYVIQEIGSFEDLPRKRFERALEWARNNGFPDVHLDNMEIPRFEVTDSEDHPLLHVAVADRNLASDILEQIVQNVGDLEVRDRNFNTPLLIAVAADMTKTVQLLVENGARLDAKDPVGHNVLHKCQTKKMAELVFRFDTKSARRTSLASTTSAVRRTSTSSRLSSQTPEPVISRIEVNSRDCFGKTALYQACEKGNIDVVSTLVQLFKADIEIAGPHGCSPLAAAIQAQPNLRGGDMARKKADANRRKIEIVQKLVMYGANREIDETIIRGAGGVASRIKKILRDTPVTHHGSAATLSSGAPSLELNLEGWTLIPNGFE
ncbi:hypothetical protein CGMCC3_g14213 [Colletotrichum fructicola]|nr:uncharacterized protein CGMCC3_g14213 [Colletotrichum fructicola]KAE9569589.1 hypothetical protein CGMCC3_g14213 [Colletotrichum fructicola]